MEQALSREDILAGARHAGNNGDLETVARLLSERFSCRAYRDAQVPREEIARLLSIAQLTASWCNAQPWGAIVTEGEGTERFRKAMFAQATAGGARSGPDIAFPSAYEGVYGDRRRDAGWALYGAMGIGKGDREGSGRQMMENFRLFGAPHVLFLTTERDLGTYGALDCGIYLGNLMMLMGAVGLASIAQGAFAAHAGFIRDYFAIPDNRQLLVGLSFGYADGEHPANGFRTTRADPGSAVNWVSE